MFEGQVDSSKRLNLLYDDVEIHYHVITNVKGSMERRRVWKACNKSCSSEITHVCDKTCSDCMTGPPCAFSEVRLLCYKCNRHFRSRTCFGNHKQSTAKGKSICESKRCCTTCGLLVTGDSHEYNKRYCANCKQNRHVGHLCYMRPLKDVFPIAGDKVLYVVYDFETTQNRRYSDKATRHVPHLVCVQQFCSQGEDVEDGDSVRCDTRKHSFSDDSVGKMILYLRETRL